jgi:hypothetical protein
MNWWKTAEAPFPDSRFVAEFAQAERRRRMFRDQQAAALPLGPDGLPNKVEISLVEAWSWCAFGRAVPQSAWAAEWDTKHADEAYAKARLALAAALRLRRRAQAAMSCGGAATPISDTTRLDYEAACTEVNGTRKAEQDRRKELASTISWCLLVEKIYDERGIPPNDKDFEKKVWDEAEQELFKAFLSGELECLGRDKRVDEPTWVPLPKDCFRLPVGIRLNHNILEATSQGSADEYRLIHDQASQWLDLRVDVTKLRAWRSPAIVSTPAVAAGPSEPEDRSGERGAKATSGGAVESSVDDETVKTWMGGKIIERRKVGQPTNLPIMVNAARAEFSDQGLGERHARKIYSTLDKKLKGRRGPKGPRISIQNS